MYNILNWYDGNLKYVVCLKYNTIFIQFTCHKYNTIFLQNEIILCYTDILWKRLQRTTNPPLTVRHYYMTRQTVPRSHTCMLTQHWPHIVSTLNILNICVCLQYCYYCFVYCVDLSSLSLFIDQKTSSKWPMVASLLFKAKRQYLLTYESRPILPFHFARHFWKCHKRQPTGLNNAGFIGMSNCALHGIV